MSTTKYSLLGLLVAILILAMACKRGTYAPNRDEMTSAEWDCYLKMKRELDQGRNINDPEYKHCCSMLTFAITKQYPEVVKFLISKGAKINQVDACEHPALWCAAHVMDLKMIDLLLDNGADARMIYKTGDDTPLQRLVASYAWSKESPGDYSELVRIIDRLIDAGCDINHQMRGEGITTLDLTTDPTIKKILIERGAKSSVELN